MSECDIISNINHFLSFDDVYSKEIYMNINKKKHSSLRKNIYISVILCFIVGIFVFGFEKQPIIKASSYGVDYFVFTEDEYENPYIGNIQNNSIKFLDGKIAYCLQSGKDLKKGVNYSLKEDLNWSLESKELLAYVLYYGYQDYHGVSADLYSNDELAHYLATQLLVWQLEYNSFYDMELKNSLLEHYSNLITNQGVQIGPKITEYYNNIWTKADIALNGGTPSFTSDSDYIASLNVYELEYNDEKKGYYLEIEDANQFLENYQVSEDSSLDVKIVENKITIFSEEEIEEEKGIILENPYFSKGMEALIWTCNDAAYQNLTNADTIIDISKTQYLYVRTKDSPEPEEDTPEPGEDTPGTEDDTPEPGEDTPGTEEDTQEPDEGTPGIEEDAQEPGEGTSESEEDTYTSESEENTTDTEKEPQEEMEFITELDQEEMEEDQNNTEDLLFEEEYQYNSEELVPEGRIIIEKMDGDTNEALSGVKFEISNYDGSFSIMKGTDENGIIDVTLPYDNYYFQEISAPAGYATNNEKISFRITDETPLLFQVINTKVPQLGMNFSYRNIGFAGLVIFLLLFLVREFKHKEKLNDLQS